MWKSFKKQTWSKEPTIRSSKVSILNFVIYFIGLSFSDLKAKKQYRRVVKSK